MVVNNEPTRDSRVLREASALLAAGHEVTVVGVSNSSVPRDEQPGGPRILRAAPLCGSESGTLRTLWRTARWYERMRPLVRAALDDARPDVLHAHDLDTVGPASRAAKSLGIPCVYDDHEASYVDKLPNYVPRTIRGPKRAVLASLNRWLAARGTSLERRVRSRGLAGIITVSDSLADELPRRFGGERPVVVRNIPAWRDTPRTNALRERIGAPPQVRILLYHGTVTEGSGVEAVIRAMALLGDGYAFVVLGKVWQQQRYEAIVREAGVGERVRILPLVPYDEMFTLIASADAAIIPTEPNSAGNRFGVPTKLFESMMAGLPLVAAGLPDVDALVRSTGAGVLYPPAEHGDPHVIADAVRRLFATPETWQTCRAAGLRAARDEFNWEIESRRLTGLYERIGGSR